MPRVESFHYLTRVITEVRYISDKNGQTTALNSRKYTVMDGAWFFTLYLKKYVNLSVHSLLT